jgi:hypothetical protein
MMDLVPVPEIPPLTRGQSGRSSLIAYLPRPDPVSPRLMETKDGWRPRRMETKTDGDQDGWRRGRADIEPRNGDNGTLAAET